MTGNQKLSGKDSRPTLAVAHATLQTSPGSRRRYLAAQPPAAPSSQRHPRSAFPRWVILFLDSGELGNRLVTYAHLVALAMEHRATVVNLDFWRYNRLFENMPILGSRPWQGNSALLRRRRARSPGRLMETGLQILLRLPVLRHRLRRQCTFDGQRALDSCDLLERTLSFLLVRASRYRSSRRILERMCDFRDEKIDGHTFSLCVPKGFAAKWSFDPQLIQKHAQVIRSCFRPTEECRRRITGLIEPLRKRLEVLVGVHMRRGDYRRYKGGRWHFADSVYRQVMTAIAELYPRQKLGFLLASDEPIDVDGFTPLDVVRAPGDPVADMYALAACDLILGPPSTFSGWASFAGDVPIYWICDEHAKPRLEDMERSWIPRWY